jgi:hypothetical protein
MVQRRRLISVLLLVALGIGGLWYLQPWRPRVEVGGIKINPHAALDPNKNYTVIVWDWELPPFMERDHPCSGGPRRRTRMYGPVS